MRTALDVLRLVHLRDLRRHPLRTTIAVVAEGAGVAMLLAILIVVRSTTASFESQAAALAGPAPLRVVGPTPTGGIRPEDLAAVAGTDGVAAAVPLVRGLRSLERDGPDGARYGDDVLLVGTTPAVADALGARADALEAGFVVTPVVAGPDSAGTALRTDVGPIPFGGTTLTPDDRLAALGPRVAVTTLADAQRYLGRGDTVDAVYVVPRDGIDPSILAERLERAIPAGLDVLPATDVPPELGQVLGLIVPLFSLMGIFAMGIGAVLVANTVALSLVERRRQLAVVTSLGGTSRQVMVGCLVQSGAVGAVAGLLGAGLGMLAAYPLTASVNRWTLGIAGIRVDALPSQAPVLLAVVFGAVVGIVAAVPPARRATRTDVAAELSLRDRREETGVPKLAARALVAFVLGVVAVGVTMLGGSNGALHAWQPAVAALGLLASLLALSYAIGRTGALAASIALRRTELRTPSVRLALANLVREPNRTAVMVLAAAAAIGVGFLSSSFTAQARAGILEMAVQGQGNDLSVTIGPRDGSEASISRPSAEVIAAIRSHPMVASTRRFGSMLISTDAEAVDVVAVDGTLSGPQVYAGTADPVRFARGEALVGARLARAQHIEAGGVAEVPTRDGPVAVPVQGIWADGTNVGQALTLPYPAVEALYGSVPVDGLYVTPVAGVSTSELATALGHDIADPALRVETADQSAARLVRFVDDRLTPFKALQVGLTALSFVAVLSTLLLVGIQRQRELGLLAATGMTPRMVFVMIVAEAGIAGIIATIVSLPLGALQSIAFRAVVPLILGWENPIRFSFSAWLFYGTLTTIVVVLGACFPAWAASRLDVVDALAYE